MNPRVVVLAEWKAERARRPSLTEAWIRFWLTVWGLR
jgi:hypothetical protein